MNIYVNTESIRKMSQKIEKNEVIELFYIIQKYKKNKNIRNILSTNYFSLKILIKYILIKLKMFKLYNDT